MSGRTSPSLSFLVHALEPRMLMSTVPVGFSESQVASAWSIQCRCSSRTGRPTSLQRTRRITSVISKDGVLSSTPFVTLDVDIHRRARAARDRLDPDFADQPLPLRLLHRHHAGGPQPRSAASPPTATWRVAGSELVLLDLDNLSSATNHNGGALHFGPDGKLYIAVGENANGANAQTLTQPPRQDAPHQPRRHHPHRQPVLQHRPPGTTAPSGRSASATRSPSPSSPAPAGCSSTTSARTPGRRSTTASPARTTAGPPPRGRPRPALPRPSTPTSTDRTRRLRHHRRRLLQPAQPPRSRPTTSATTSSPTSATAGSAARSRRAGRRSLRHRHLRPPVDLEVSPDGSLYYLARGTALAPACDFRVHRQPGAEDHDAARRARSLPPASPSPSASPPAARRR